MSHNRPMLNASVRVAPTDPLVTANKQLEAAKKELEALKKHKAAISKQRHDRLNTEARFNDTNLADAADKATRDKLKTALTKAANTDFQDVLDNTKSGSPLTSLQEKIDAQQVKVDAAQAAYDAAALAVQAAEQKKVSDLAPLGQDARMKNDAHEAAKRDKVDLQARQREALNELQTEIADKANFISRQTANLNNLERQEVALIAAGRERELGINNLSDEIGTVEDMLEETREQIKDTNKAIADNAKGIQVLTKLTKNLNVQLIQSKDSQSVPLQNTGVKASTPDQLEKDLADAKKQLESKTKAKSALENTLGVLKEKEQEEARRVRGLIDKHKVAQQTEDAAYKQLKKLQDRIPKEIKTLQDAEGKAADLSDNLADMQEKHQEDLDTAEAAVIAKKADYDAAVQIYNATEGTLTLAVGAANTAQEAAKQTLIGETKALTQLHQTAVHKIHETKGPAIAEINTTLDETEAFIDKVVLQQLTKGTDVSDKLKEQAEKLTNALTVLQKSNAYLDSKVIAEIRRVVDALKAVSSHANHDHMKRILRTMEDRVLVNDEYFGDTSNEKNKAVKLAYEGCIQALNIIIDQNKLETIYGSGAVFKEFSSATDETVSMRDLRAAITPANAGGGAGAHTFTSTTDGEPIEGIKSRKGYAILNSDATGEWTNLTTNLTETGCFKYAVYHDAQGKKHIESVVNVARTGEVIADYTDSKGTNIKIYDDEIKDAYTQLKALTNNFTLTNCKVHLEKMNQNRYNAFHYVAKHYNIQLGARPSGCVPVFPQGFSLLTNAQVNIDRYIISLANKEKEADIKQTSALKDIGNYILSKPVEHSQRGKEYYTFAGKKRQVTLYENDIKEAYEILKSHLMVLPVRSLDTPTWQNIIETQTRFDAFCYVAEYLKVNDIFNDIRDDLSAQGCFKPMEERKYLANPVTQVENFITDMERAQSMRLKR